MGKIYMYLAVLLLLSSSSVLGQGLHFSQYYQTPLLLNPANTALMPEADYRANAQYRTQWANIPAPFTTLAASADFQLLRNTNQTNWLGIGLAVFNDRAGNGNLSLFKGQLTAAYHVQLGSSNMISVGLGAALVQRSVDFSKLTFDTQWDGFIFNTDLAHGEPYQIAKTSYPDVAAGINYAYFPNEFLYIKLGLGVLHINQPNESFYGMQNKLGMRPTANVDVRYQLNSGWIAEISGYYSRQKSASEIVYGGLFSSNITPEQRRPNVLIFGVYHRMADALIPVIGFEWQHIRLLASMDITLSPLSQANRSNGAFEFSISYQGLYNRHSQSRDAYNCPRF